SLRIPCMAFVAHQPSWYRWRAESEAMDGVGLSVAPTVQAASSRTTQSWLDVFCLCGKPAGGMAMTHTEDAAVRDEFQRTLRDGLLRTQFQPIVNVRSRNVVGYEALVRGPAGSIVESPDTLIAEAYRQNRVVEFDWKARATASRAALASGLSAEELL